MMLAAMFIGAIIGSIITIFVMALVSANKR